MVTYRELGAMGRMGNQLFQVGVLLGYATKHKIPYIIPNWKYAEVFEGKFPQTPAVPIFQQYKEPRFQYDEIPEFHEVDLYGYYQSQKYWEHCEQDIKDAFSFKEHIRKEIRGFIAANSGGKPTCSVHLRRSDYLTMSHYYHNLTLDWYIEAMSRFPGHHFFVVSDDVLWAEQHLIQAEGSVTFSHFDEIRDMCLMTECDHNVIANSSFSFWGSYLNNNPNKRIIAPAKDKWFKPIAGHNVDDLYLPNWELI